MKTLKANEEFVKGKHNIGYVDSDFNKEYKDEEFEMGTVLPSQKLTRSMTDAEIIGDLKVQECTLGDVLATINSATEDMKDGYSNLFYIKGHPSRVVFVRWDGGEWDVRVWRRESGWTAGRRVFSPATEAQPLSTKSSDTLEFCSCERCGQCGKLVKINE